MKPFSTTKKRLMIYDAMEHRGGAERVALSMLQNMGMDLCVSTWNPDSFSPDMRDAQKIRTLFAPSRNRLINALKRFYHFSFRTHFITQYDAVIYSGAYAPLASKAKKALKIYYCHTPPRSLYDQYRFHVMKRNMFMRAFFILYSVIYRSIYEHNISRMDLIISNSKNIQDRLKQYLDMDSEVIYPPCATSSFRWIGQKDYYLSTARLAKLKRVDCIINAFKNMPDKKLVVTSGGPEYSYLIKLAQGYPNISFTGWIPDRELKQLIGNCVATVYIPVDEDFGLSPVESMAAGKPVIGVNEGGLKETVMEDKTGILISINDIEKGLQAAVKQLTPQKALALRDNCEKRAELFSEDTFIEKMKSVLVKHNETRQSK